MLCLELLAVKIPALVLVRYNKRMVYDFDGFNWLIRMQKGERLSEQLEQFFKETKLEGAWISGVGGALEAEFGIFDLAKKEYVFQTFPGPLEILSLQGNISLDEDGNKMFHLHGAFSGPGNKAVGGHVKDLVVGATLELFTHRTYKPVHRKFDEEIGLKLLDL
jgi:uncharacterized protein